MAIHPSPSNEQLGISIVGEGTGGEVAFVIPAIHPLRGSVTLPFPPAFPEIEAVLYKFQDMRYNRKLRLEVTMTSLFYETN